MTIIVAAFFILWAIISVMSQYTNSFFLKYNFWGFVPYCRFFTPRPLSKDLKIYYRTFDEDEIERQNDTHWVQYTLFKKNSFSFIWNPHNKLKKASNIIVQNLMHNVRSQEYYELSIPYLTLLNLLSSECANSKKFIQFFITRHAGYEDSVREAMFISKIHKID